MIDPGFWRNRRVFLTGHTGLGKGAWMTPAAALARRAGFWFFMLPPEGERDLFNVAGVKSDVEHQIGDVARPSALARSLRTAKPEIVIHMAAQSLVRLSYDEPVETYATNVMGTVHLLEAAPLGSRSPCHRGGDQWTSVTRTLARCAGYNETDAMGVIRSL